MGNCIQMAAALICCPLLLQRVSLKQTPISCMLLASVAADPQTRDPLRPEVKIFFNKKSEILRLQRYGCSGPHTLTIRRRRGSKRSRFIKNLKEAHSASRRLFFAISNLPLFQQKISFFLGGGGECGKYKNPLRNRYTEVAFFLRGGAIVTGLRRSSP